MMAMSAALHLQQPPAKVEYFYVYVAEAEFSTVGYWIQLEPDKSLSLEALRGYFQTCFGIKYKVVAPASGNAEVRYIRYHNGYFRFPSGLDLNNTRFWRIITPTWTTLRHSWKWSIRMTMWKEEEEQGIPEKCLRWH